VELFAYFFLKHWSLLQNIVSPIRLNLDLHMGSWNLQETWWCKPFRACGNSCGAKNSVSRVLQCLTLCCSVLQCVAVCCSVLQCVAVRYHVLWSSHKDSQICDCIIGLNFSKYNYNREREIWSPSIWGSEGFRELHNKVTRYLWSPISEPSISEP